MFVYRWKNVPLQRLMPLILILRPQKWFGIMGAELKRVVSLGQFMMVDGTVRGCHVDIGQEDMHELATLCEALRPDSLYARYANKKVFRHEEDFWTTKEKAVIQHVKRMADRCIVKVVGLADKLDIPIIYAKDQKAPLHIKERLSLENGKEVTPVMNFHRHDEGTTYRLHLRINGNMVESLAEHQPVVLTYEPGLFILDKCIYALGERFSGQLLLPFVNKQQVEIPQKVENDYFRRFILKQVARAEINAEGFNITDVSIQPQAPICLFRRTAKRKSLS